MMMQKVSTFRSHIMGGWGAGRVLAQDRCHSGSGVTRDRAPVPETPTATLKSMNYTIHLSPPPPLKYLIYIISSTTMQP